MTLIGCLVNRLSAWEVKEKRKGKFPIACCCYIHDFTHMVPLLLFLYPPPPLFASDICNSLSDISLNISGNSGVKKCCLIIAVVWISAGLAVSIFEWWIQTTTWWYEEVSPVTQLVSAVVWQEKWRDTKVLFFCCLFSDVGLVCLGPNSYANHLLALAP